MGMTLDIWIRAFLVTTTLMLAVAAPGPSGTERDEDTHRPSIEAEESGPREDERSRSSRSQRREDGHRAVPDPTGHRQRPEQDHDVEPSGDDVDPADASDPSPGRDDELTIEELDVE